MSTKVVTQNEIEEARKKFSEMYSNVKLGGKGTQKRKKFVQSKSTAVQDKKITALAKKTQAKKLTDTAEVNIFRDDHTVIHFKKPSLEYSVKEKVSFLTGPSEVKNLTDLLPGLIRQLGPKQYPVMQEYAETLKYNQLSSKRSDDVPDLVDFEEVSKKN